MALEDAAQRKRRIARRQYGGRHLVEQRLELLIVILIDQRDANIRVRSQFTRTVQSGETATDYNDVLHRGFLSDRLDQPWKQGNLHGTSLVANPLHVPPKDDLLPSIVELGGPTVRVIGDVLRSIERAKYIRDLAIRGRAERTQEAYTRYVCDLARYYRRSPELISYEEVRDWLYHLIKERKPGAWKSTRAARWKRS
jgi:Phage integrase, N-terminal SAM-like domain